MKKLLIPIIIILIPLISLSQDSLLTSKHSFSITAGYDIVFPAVNQYHEVEGELNSRYYFDFIIEPEASLNSWIRLSYNYSWPVNSSLSYSFIAGLGYAPKTYKSIHTGTEHYTDIVRTHNFTGTLANKDIRKYFEINLGISGNIKIKNNLIWQNQFGICSDILIFHNYGHTIGPDINYYTDAISSFFYLQTGINFRLNEKFAISPVLEFPLLSLHTIWKKIGETYNETDPYDSFRFGIKLTLSKTP